MLVNGMLNLAIGLALTFGVVSLVTSAFTEAIASVLDLRARTLLAGIKKLLNDPRADGLALAVLQHAGVNPLGNGQAPANPALWQQNSGRFADVRKLLGTVPSYVDAKGFANALIDAIQNRQQPTGFIANIQQALGEVADDSLRAALQGLYARANNSADALHAEVATWFDSAMDRLSGTYKRRSQAVGLLIATAIVLLLNVDAVAIARHIYADPGLAAHVPAAGDPKEVARFWLDTFPYGWAEFSSVSSARGTGAAVLLASPGWAMTVLATLFGAPFWFDTLQRFVQVRGTGPDPKRAG